MFFDAVLRMNEIKVIVVLYKIEGTSLLYYYDTLSSMNLGEGKSSPKSKDTIFKVLNDNAKYISNFSFIQAVNSSNDKKKLSTL